MLLATLDFWIKYPVCVREKQSPSWLYSVCEWFVCVFYFAYGFLLYVFLSVVRCLRFIYLFSFYFTSVFDIHKNLAGICCVAACYFVFSHTDIAVIAAVAVATIRTRSRSMYLNSVRIILLFFSLRFVRFVACVAARSKQASLSASHSQPTN